MEILFTKRSKLISAVLKEPVTHVAIRYNNIVVHSDSKGLRMESYKVFDESTEIVYTVSIEDDVDKLLELFAKYTGRGYDFPAAIYIGLRRLLKPIVSLPKKNLWQTSGLFICSEWASKYAIDVEDSTITPYGLYLKLRKTHANK